MKAFISLVLAIAFVYVTLLLLSYYLEARSSFLGTEKELLILKNYNTRELEVKRAVTNTIHHALQEIPPGMEAENASRYIAGKLAGLESLEAGKGGKYYQTYHLDLNFWCGFIDEETGVMKKEMLEKTSSIKCLNCKDLDEFVPKYSIENIIASRVDPTRLLQAVETMPACTPFLSYNRENKWIKVSEPPAEYVWIGDNPAIGISILDTVNNISSIVIIPEGTIIR
jgi:hypothetical protein